jgi:hypothetical protein
MRRSYGASDSGPRYGDTVAASAPIGPSSSQPGLVGHAHHPLQRGDPRRAPALEERRLGLDHRHDAGDCVDDLPREQLDLR